MHTAIYIIVVGKLGPYPSMIIFMSRLMQNITFTPLNRPRQLRGHVIDHPVHPLHLVDDPRRHAADDTFNGDGVMLKTYKGSCHCGAIPSEAYIDLAAETGKCHCSIRTEKRNSSVIIKPDPFRVLARED